MKNAINYYEPVLGTTESLFNFEIFKSAIDLYQEEQYLNAFHTFLDSLNPNARKEYGNEEGTEFHIPHGSIIIDLLLKDNRLIMNADFMKLPEKGGLPMLRQVAGLNINETTLVNFQLNDDILRMKYDCHISQTHPHKLYDVLREFCEIGDKYDDEFESEFNAQRIYQPIIKPYSQEVVDKVYNSIQEICKYTTEAIAEYNQERAYGYSWNILDVAFYQIMYFASPQGALLNEIDKAISDMNRDLTTQEVVSKGVKVLEQLAAMPKEELAKDLYFVDTLISTKMSSSLGNIQSNFEDTYENVTQAIQSGNTEGAALRILYKFYEMYYYTDVMETINQFVSATLKEASGKPWDEAAEILYKMMNRIMDDNLDEDSDDFGFLDDYTQAVEEAMTAVQEGTGEIQAEIEALQKQMMEALAKGDMEEYMRLVAQMQQGF